MSQLLVMLKPKGLILEENLIEMIEGFGSIQSRREWDPAPMDKIKELYAPHRGKWFYKPNCDVFDGKPVITYVLEGEGDDETLVKPVRAVIGDTNPALAEEGTFRYLVWTVLYRKNPQEGDMRELSKRGKGIDNGVHCSDSLANGKREVEIFYG